MRTIKRNDYKQENLLTHYFYLRPEIQITFNLPNNLNLEEASRLGLFIRGLAYAEQSEDDELILHRLPIREKMVAIIHIPMNITEHEALRLSEFLTAIPF